jgi:hypothetical protein
MPSMSSWRCRGQELHPDALTCSCGHRLINAALGSGGQVDSAVPSTPGAELMLRGCLISGASGEAE